MKSHSARPSPQLQLQTLPSDEPALPRVAFPPPVVHVPVGIHPGVRYGVLTARYFIKPQVRRRGAGAARGGWKVRCAKCQRAHVLAERDVRKGACPDTN